MDEHNYLSSLKKKLIEADFSAFTDEIEVNPKAPKFKVDIEPELLSTKNV